MYVWLIMLVLFMKLEWFTKLFSTIAGLPNRFPHRKSLLCIGNLWHTVIINTTCLPCPPRDTYLQQQAENSANCRLCRYDASFDAKRETVCLFCIVSDTIVNNPYNPTSWLTFDAIRLGP